MLMKNDAALVDPFDLTGKMDKSGKMTREKRFVVLSEASGATDYVSGTGTGTVKLPPIHSNLINPPESQDGWQELTHLPGAVQKGSGLNFDPAEDVKDVDNDNGL